MTLHGPVPALSDREGSSRLGSRVRLAAALVLAAGLAVPAPALQEAPPQGATQAAPAAGKFRFSFKDAPLDQVLDFFARRAGLPIIFEAPVPQGTLTFIGADDYSFEEALTILNLNLRLRGVQLRREDRFLYLGKLEDSMRTSTRVAGETLPEGVRPEEVVNVTIPLQNARAEDVAKQVQQLVGPYGGVLAVPTQNMLIVVETAAQVRRLREIIGAIDAVRPVDTSYRLFALRHARAEAVLAALKSLMGERRQTIVIDKDNNRRTIDEQTVPGLNMTADPRTNSIVAVGPEARIRVVEEMIALLDVPESAGTETEVRSFALASISADQAAQRLNALFARVPDPKPVIVPVPDLGRVTVVGPSGLLEQAGRLLAQVDPGHGGAGEGSRTIAVIALRHAAPQAVESLLNRMLTPRQAQAVRVAASPDGRGLVVTGPTVDVEAIRELIAGVDVPPRLDRQVRLVKVPTGDPAAILEQARALDERTGQHEQDPVSCGVEAESRTIWIAGSPGAQQRFGQILSQVQANLVADVGVRLIQGLRVRPSVLAERAERLLEPMLAPADGGAWTRPVIEPVDSISAVVVRADPRHLQTIDDLIRRLDGDESANAQIRVIELQNARASEAAAFLRDWAGAARSLLPRGGPSPAFEAVDATNTLIISAQSWQLPILEQLARGLDARRVGERPPLRLLTLRTTDAANVAAILRSRFDARPPEARAAHPVSIDVDAATNTLVVSAHAEALAEIEDVVSQLNEQQAKDAAGREIRIFPLRVARAEELALTLDQMFPEPPMPVDRQTGRPRPDLRPPREVVVRADRGTNSIIVDAPSARMAGFEQLVRSLDTRKVPEDVELRTYRVTRADVGAVANALRTAAAAGALGKGDAATHAGPVTVEIEPVSRAVVVTGPSAVFAGVERIVAELEGLAARPTTTLSMYPLRHARADRVLPLVQRLLVSRVRDMQSREGGLPPGDAAGLVEVASDAASNTLLVSAPAEAQASAAEIIRGLDQPAASAATDVRVFRLSRGRAQDAAAALRVALLALARPGEDAPSVAPEPSSNALIVTGTAAQLARAQALIDQLDNEAVQPDGLGVRTLVLRHTRAETVVPVLQQVLARDDGLAGLPDWVRGQIVARRLDAAQPPEVRVAADRRLNAVVVSGPQRILDLAEQVVAQLDSGPADGSSGGLVLRVITLRNAEARELAAGIEGVFAEGPAADGPPPTVRVDSASNSLIVRGTPEQLRTIEELTRRLDEAAVSASRQLRTVPLDRSRVDAQLMARTLQRLLEQRGGMKVEVISTEELLRRAAEEPEPPRPRSDARPVLPGGILPALVAAVFAVQEQPAAATSDVTIAVDPHTNSLLLLGSPQATERLAKLAAELQNQIPGEPAGVRIVTLPPAFDAQTIVQIVRPLINQIGQMSPTNPGGFTGPVSVVPDPTGSAVIVLANDTDFAVVGPMIASITQLEAASALTVKVYRLVNLPAARAKQAVDDLVSATPRGVQARRVRGLDVTVEGGPGQPPVQGRIDPSLVRTVADPSGGTLIVAAPAETIPLVDRFVALIDQSESALPPVRSIRLERADAATVAQSVQRLFQERASSRAGERPRVSVVGDRRTGTLLIAASDEDFEQIAALVRTFDAPGQARDLQFKVITLKHARASDISNTVQNIASQFQWERMWGGRARGEGQADDTLLVEVNERTNSVVVFGQGELLATVERVIQSLDQPDAGAAQLAVRVTPYGRGDPQALKTAIERAMATPGWRSWRGPDPDAVTIEIDRQRRVVILVGRQGRVEQAASLLEQLASIEGGADRIEAVPLTTARATDVAAALRAALPQTVAITITPVARSNTLLLTGSDEAIALAVEQVRKIDTEPARSPMVFRRFALENALAEDVAWTINQMMRSRPRQQGEPAPAVDWSRTENTLMVSASADEIESIAQMVRELDVPAPSPRRIEFVRMRFAKAEAVAAALRMFYGPFASAAQTPGARNVTIVADPASNSLVIHAGAAELEGVRSLLDTLDTEQYDTTRQLAVIPLAHADATSVARALNEGFRVPIESQIRQQQARQPQRPGSNAREQEPLPPMVLVEGEAPPSVSPEPQTNALIVFAGRRDLERIQAIVKQLDVPEFNKLAAVRILPLRAGKASALAATIRDLYARQAGAPGTARGGGPRSAVVIGDDTAGALIVRADDEQFAEIKALADAYQQQGELGRLTTHVVRLKRIPASRLRQTILSSFAATAEQYGERLAVEVERTTNTLVVASSPRLFEEIRKVIEELDGALPDAGGDEPAGISQSVIIVDVKNNAPQALAQQLEALGLTRPTPADRPGIVTEPVTITPMTTRRALAIVVNPGDAPAVRSLVEALDADPGMKDQHVAIVPLRLAEAEVLAATLRQMIAADAPGAQAGTAAARALAEQVRRLSVHRAGAGQPPLELDLASPIRLIADRPSNSVIIGSTASNVEALREVAASLDSLPLGEAVVVRIFPLANASALRTKAVIDQIFAQGERLRRVPGTQRQGLPTTVTGRALAGEVATSADERTNSLLVAGREEAVALVEVLIRDLDSDEVSHWVEPAIITLEHADPSEIADRLNTVLVRGLAASPEAMGLQRQFGRLRVTLSGADARDPNARVQADLFAPVQSLSIVPVPESAALLVVGTPNNIEVVRELVKQLDVESASAANRVRFFPLQRAAADRIAAMLREIFNQRQQAGGLRPEDRLVVTADTRTNTLVVATSARSFALVERLVEQLDTLQAHPSVGLHVIAVESASAAEIGPQVERLMRERIRATRGTGGVADPLDVFSVVVEPANNLLIISASDENVQVVRELLAALTRDAERLAAGTVVELFMLEKSRPAEAVASLRQLYVDREVERRGPAALAVFPNERLNAVVVRGSPRDVEAIRGLIGRIDGAAVSAVREVRRIELTSANALEVVNTLRDVLAGRPVAGAPGGARQATRLRFVRESLSKHIEGQTGVAPAEADIDAAVREQISITPELRSNSVIVSAPADIVALVGQIIEDLDSTLSGIREIATFRLVNADARQMAELLRGVFNLRQEGNLYVLVPAPEPAATSAPGVIGPEAPPGGSGSLSVTAVPDERQQLSIAVDARTNSIVVSGSPRYLDRVRQLVTELDSIQAAERASYVFHLRNAKAKEVEATLRDYFRFETELRRQTLGPGQIGALERQLEQEVTVVGDEKSNKIVFSTSPRYTEKVMDLLRELDAAPPQVMIQVLLAEVTIDESSQWGMDARFGPFGGDEYRASSLGGGAGVGTSLGVPNLAVSSADFSLLIRALQAQGKLQVLSNPQVLANNNEKASIQVGENVAIVSGTERTPQGSLRADVTRQDVGIILDVTPTISTDGFVRMSIEPTISAVTAKTTQISADLSAPIISKRTVSTVVTVKDGQSVLIGGLIQTQDEKRRSKVPILGDIPILGLPFRTMHNTRSKTELLVILTPHVVPGGSMSSRVDALTNAALDRVSQPANIRAMIEQQRIPRQPGPVGPLLDPEPEDVPPASDQPREVGGVSRAPAIEPPRR
jgi:type II secretion system protein D